MKDDNWGKLFFSFFFDFVEMNVASLTKPMFTIHSCDTNYKHIA